jgi:glutathione S-transferase
MVKLTVYGSGQASCCQRVLILLEELELHYELQNVDIAGGETKEEKFLDMQPFGKVPVVKYGDRVLFESRAILRYIARANRDIEDFIPSTEADVWLEVESNNFDPYASKIVYEKVYKKGEPTSSALLDEWKESLEKTLDVYDKRLEKVPYIAGDQYTVADMAHIPYAYQLLKCGYKDIFKSRPHVYNWLKRIMKRDAVRSVLEAK